MLLVVMKQKVPEDSWTMQDGPFQGRGRARDNGELRAGMRRLVRP